MCACERERVRERKRDAYEHTDLEHENLLAVLFGHLLGQAISARERRGGWGVEGRKRETRRTEIGREGEMGRGGDRERGRERPRS